ncbi:hypothetical protein [Embleya sp. NPDC059237]|uniref:hypothetical protein n=1 Tax=Embleya sp. NPDC059237 TaxID=3346784 RepID=UPI0036905331
MKRLPEKPITMTVHRDVLPEVLTILPLLDAVAFHARVDDDGTVHVRLLAHNVPEDAESMTPHFAVMAEPRQVFLTGVGWYRADGTRLTPTER